MQPTALRQGGDHTRPLAYNPQHGILPKSAKKVKNYGAVYHLTGCDGRVKLGEGEGK